MVLEKVSDSVSKKIGIGKSIGFGIEKNWYRKKVSDSVSFRFWVSSHTGLEEPLVVEALGFRISRRKPFQMEKRAAAQYLTNYVFDKYATARGKLRTVDDYAN